MNRKNRVRSIIIFCLLIAGTVILFAAWNRQKPISGDAVLVKYEESLLERERLE